MKRKSAGAASEQIGVGPLLVLVGAVLLSLPGALSAAKLWLRLPIVHARRVDQSELTAAFDAVRRRSPPEAREAFALRLASHTLTGALTGRLDAAELEQTVADAVGTLTRSQVGRLQRAAARMWLLERRGEPIENWWPQLHVFFQGMRQANLSHYQAALVRDWARAYELAGFGPGTARSLAEDLVAQRHGPFLQFFTSRVRRLIADRLHAGDAAAARVCRTTLYRLLRQWVLEPGPAGLRLLAADLLAQAAEHDPAAGGSAAAQELARELRAWRSAYREALRRLPIGVFDPHRKPALDPAADQRLLQCVALTNWLAAALLVVAAAALVALLRGPRRVLRPGNATLVWGALLVGALVVLGGLGAVWLWPDWLRTDLRGDFSSLRYLWRHPFVAAGIALVGLLLAALLRPGPRAGKSTFASRLGAAGAGAWLLLAVGLWAAATAGQIAHSRCERAIRAACEDSISAVAGPHAQRLLARLHDWEPGRSEP